MHSALRPNKKSYTFLLLLGVITTAPRASGFLPGHAHQKFQRLHESLDVASTPVLSSLGNADLSRSVPRPESPTRPKRPWRPAGLPNLSTEDLRTLSMNIPVESQTRSGNGGGGYVVLDVKGTPEAVWSLLTDYERYDEIIPTVRKSSVRAGSTRQCARATFQLSKFKLDVSVLHLFHEQRQHLTFSLDPASSNVVLKEAEGLWFVESRAEGLRPGHVRVWFGASVTVSRLVPRLVVDYAASRALRRATAWIREAVEHAPLTLAAVEAQRRTATGDTDMPGTVPISQEGPVIGQAPSGGRA